MAQVDLTLTYQSPIQANAVDCPYGTTTSCNSQVLSSATKYTFNNPLMNATTNEVVMPHTVTVILSNFDGDVDKTISLMVKQIAPKYRQPSSNAIIRQLTFLAICLVSLVYLF